MKAIIWKITKKMPSKIHDNTFNQVIVFKSLNETDKTNYKLNLDYRFMQHVNRWLPNIQEGNVLDVNIRQGTKNVDMFAQYKLIDKKQTNIINELEKRQEKCDHCEHYLKIKEQISLFD